MEQDVKEKPKAALRKSLNLKKELDVGAEESGGQDKNGSMKRQHSTSTKHKSTSSPRSSSSSTTPSAPLSPSSTSALSTSPPAVTESSKRRPTGSSQPSSRPSSDNREPRAKGTKITPGADDHNGAAPASSPSPSETPLKKSTRSSSSLAPQLQHSPATKPKSPHPTKEASATLEEEEDDSDEDLVIDFPLRPAATQSQPSGKAPGAPASKAAAGGKKETRSSGSNSNKESVEEGEAGSGARRRSMEASPAGAMGVAAAAAGKTEPVRRRQPTERRDRSQSARLDVRKRSHTADPRSPTGGGGGQRMSSPNVKPSKEGSHSARESTSRLARDEEENDQENDQEGRSNAGKNRRERNSQDLKKTLSTGSIRSNVEKDASAKDSKSGGSKQSKSNRDLNKLCQEDKAGLSPNLSLSLPPLPFSLFPFAYLGGLQSGRRRWARRHQHGPREDAPPRHNRRER